MPSLRLDAIPYPFLPKQPLGSTLLVTTSCKASVPFPGPKHDHQLSSYSLFTCHTSLSPLNAPLTSTNYASILDSCSSKIFGKSIHAHALKCGYQEDEFVETKLLQMYNRCDCLYDACILFDKMPVRNLYSWVTIIGAHVNYGLFEDAFGLFRELLYEEDISLEFFLFPVVINVCTGLMDIDVGKQIHGIVIKGGFLSNVYVCNALIDMYGKFRNLVDAKKVFEAMDERDRVSWNSISSACAVNGMVYEALENLEKMSRIGNLKPNVISWTTVINGFAQNGFAKEAVELLVVMQTAGIKPSPQTLASVLPAYASLQSVSLGKEIHGYITRHDFMSCPILVNGLVNVYRKCGDMTSALKIFERFSVKNQASFNAMIVGYCEQGEGAF